MLLSTTTATASKRHVPKHTYGFFIQDEMRPDYWQWVENPVSKESPCTIGIAYLSKVNDRNATTKFRQANVIFWQAHESL